jgi:general secretion pathway protein A
MKVINVITMYEAYFGLKERPYRISPDPRFLFLAPQHREVLSKCQYMISNKVGPVYVYGPIGSGKTSIARRIHQELELGEAYNVVLLSSPRLRSANAFLRTAMSEFGVKTERSYDRSLSNFSKFLVERYEAGQTPVLLVDEAHDLGKPILELVKFLLNYETNTQKLLQILLFGQNELATAIGGFPELKSRMFPTALAALNVEDTAEMIAWRFQMAGGQELPFSAGAIQEVFRYSLGLPREVCRICDLALLSAFTRKTKNIGPAIIQEVALDLTLEPNEEVLNG